MSALDFSAALTSLGIRCEIEEQGRLAVVVLLPPVPDAVLRSEASLPSRSASDEGKDPSLALRMTMNVFDARTRRTIVALGRTHGFANVCVELRPVDATLPRD